MALKNRVCKDCGNVSSLPLASKSDYPGMSELHGKCFRCVSIIGLNYIQSINLSISSKGR